MASIETPAIKTINTRTQELIAVLSRDPELIAGILNSINFVRDDIMLAMLSSDTPTGQAAILVEAVRKKIEVAPERFFEFLAILTEHSTHGMEVVERLCATYESEFTDTKFYLFTMGIIYRQIEQLQTKTSLEPISRVRAHSGVTWIRHGWPIKNYGDVSYLSYLNKNSHLISNENLWSLVTTPIYRVM